MKWVKLTASPKLESAGLSQTSIMASFVNFFNLKISCRKQADQNNTNYMTFKFQTQNISAYKLSSRPLVVFHAEVETPCMIH